MARTDTIDIAFRAELADFQKRVKQIPGITQAEVKKLEKAWKDGQKVAEASAKGMADAFEGEAKKIKELGKVVGGSFGELGNVLEDVGGAATAGLGPLALFGAALVGAGLAVTGLVTGTLEAARNIETLTEHFTDAEREAYAPAIESLTELNLTLEVMAKQSAVASVILAGDMAPAVGEATLAWVGFRDTLLETYVYLSNLLKLAGQKVGFDFEIPRGVQTLLNAAFPGTVGAVDLFRNLADRGREVVAEQKESLDLAKRLKEIADATKPTPTRLRPPTGTKSKDAAADEALRADALEAFAPAGVASWEAAQASALEAMALADDFGEAISAFADANAQMWDLYTDLGHRLAEVEGRAGDPVLAEIEDRYLREIELIGELEAALDSHDQAEAMRHFASKRRDKEILDRRRELIQVSAADGVGVAAGFASSLVSIAETSAAFMERSLEAYRIGVRIAAA